MVRRVKFVVNKQQVEMGIKIYQAKKQWVRPDIPTFALWANVGMSGLTPLLGRIDDAG